MKKKLLLTGSTGLFGRAFLELADKNYFIYPTYSGGTAISSDLKKSFIKLDITKKKDISAFFKTYQPSIVVHAASIGNVDYCEKHKKEAYEVNVVGTRNLVIACAQYKAKLIFLSSNAVFDGNNAPYSEKSKTSPLNYYGKTKVMAENLIKKSEISYVIARLVLMYGWHHSFGRENPVTWLIKKLKNKEKVKLVNDTYTNPIYNMHAAKAMWKIIKDNKKGIFHIAGKERVNRYEFGVKVAKIFGYDVSNLEPVTSDYFSGIAKRMPDTTYNTQKMEKELGIRPFSLAIGLRNMKKQHPL